MNKYKTLLFDLDGTIADTDEMIVQTFQKLYDLYRGGKQTPVEKIVYFSGPPIFDTIDHEFPSQKQELIYNEFCRISGELYPSTVKAYPDAKEVLLKLKKAGFKLGIVTNKVHKSTLFCLSLIGLDGIFDAIVAVDDVKHSKPNKEPMLKAMKLLNEKNKHHTLYIGDNEIDLISANNAGIDCGLVYWGPRKLSDKLKPALKINSFKELEGILINE